MYTTKLLSHIKKNPNTLLSPPEGPNSGYLVIQDHDDDDQDPTTTYCLGLCDDPFIKELPFPQTKRMLINDTTILSGGPFRSYTTTYYGVYFIPVVNMPLSYNRYYMINADEKIKGEFYASSKEQTHGQIPDVKQRPLFHPNDIYQQFEFNISNDGLQAKCIARDGRLPSFLRKESLGMVPKSIRNFTIQEARGMNSSLRAQLPNFNFPHSQKCSNSEVVGKWYCPFMFIKEEARKKGNKLKNSLLFYELTLEQRWKRIYATNRSYTQGNKVKVDVVVPTKRIRIEGKHVVQQECVHDEGGGVVYYKSVDRLGVEKCVGLSSLIVNRMMWEENRVGWINEKRKSVRVVRNEEYGGDGYWLNYGCYVLIETFSLKRNDGSVVLTFEFWHTSKIRNKWV